MAKGGGFADFGIAYDNLYLLDSWRVHIQASCAEIIQWQKTRMLGLRMMAFRDWAKMRVLMLGNT